MRDDLIPTDLVRLKGHEESDVGIVLAPSSDDETEEDSCLVNVHWHRTRASTRDEITTERACDLELVDREVMVGDVVESDNGARGVVTAAQCELDILINTEDGTNKVVRGVDTNDVRHTPRFYRGQWVTMQGWLGRVTMLYFDMIVRLVTGARQCEGELRSFGADNLRPTRSFDRLRRVPYSAQPVRATRETLAAVRWSKDGPPPDSASMQTAVLSVVDPILVLLGVEWFAQAGSFRQPPATSVDPSALLPLSEPTKHTWRLGDSVQYDGEFDRHTADVIGLSTRVDVVWQDSTTSQLPASSIMVLDPDDSDGLVFPGDYVRLAHDESRLFVVRRVGRTDALLMPFGERKQPRSPQLEDLAALIPDSSYAFRAGDVVLRRMFADASDSDSDDSSEHDGRLRDLGEVMSLQPDGVRVRWMDASVSSIKPWALQTVAAV
jgi:hypothetical protein